MTTKNFVPATREEAVNDCIRVAREYCRRDSQIAKDVGRKVLRKAKALKAAADWEAVLWQPLSDF